MSFPHDWSQHSSHHPDIGERKQGHQLCGVLDQITVTHVDEAELPFDYPEVVFDLGTDAGLAFLELISHRRKWFAPA